MRENHYYCYVCSEKPCEFIVEGNKKLPFACPFDKKFNAIWKEKKND